MKSFDNTKEKTAAILTLKKPGLYTQEGREDIAKWLRKQAKHLVDYGDQYIDTGDYRARYYYAD